MNRRAEHSGDMTPASSKKHKRNGRMVPSDHPNQAVEMLESSKATGLRMISVVERSGLLGPMEERFNGSRGRKMVISVKAMLVVFLVTKYTSDSCTRADMCRAIPGLKPSVARSIGVLDADGEWHIPSYKSLNRFFKRLERSLRRGWISGDTLCDLDWFAESLVRASVPREVRRSVETVVIDSTGIEAFGCAKEFTKQKELEKDAYAHYRRMSLENPDLPDPELKRQLLADEARKRGLRVGRDGRIIRGADYDARAGWMTGTDSRSGRYFVGYELTAVVAVQTIRWSNRMFGSSIDPEKFKYGPRVPPYILAISLNPAGYNPGPIGAKTVLSARGIAPKIWRVVADRGFTLKRESFLRALHKEKIDVVMDYTKQVVDHSHPTAIGQRRESVIVHCGTILPPWTPRYWRKPPNDIRGDAEQLAQWYDRRAALYRYGFKGWLKDGGMKLQCPACAGRVATTQATSGSGSYNRPLVPTPADGACCGGKVNALPPEVDHCQKLHYGTPVWRAVYGKSRAVVEGVFGGLKHHGGLGRGTCEALGLAANTMAVAAAAVAHNVRKSVIHDEFDSDGDDPGYNNETPDGAPPS